MVKISTVVFDIGGVLLSLEGNGEIKENTAILKNLSKKYRVFAITDAPRNVIEEEMIEFDFYQYFEAVLVSEDLKMGKDVPDIYMYFLKQYNLDPGECLFIDDRWQNIKAAKRAGFNTIAYKAMDNPIESISQYGVEI